MHFVAVIVRTTVLDAVASKSLRYAIAGTKALIMVGGFTKQWECRWWTSAAVLHLSPDNTEALRRIFIVHNSSLIQSYGFPLTCAPIALSALVKLILADCPCVMYCQCSFNAFSPQNSSGGKSESGKSHKRTAAAAQPRPVNLVVFNQHSLTDEPLLTCWITLNTEQLKIEKNFVSCSSCYVPVASFRRERFSWTFVVWWIARRRNDARIQTRKVLTAITKLWFGYFKNVSSLETARDVFLVGV